MITRWLGHLYIVFISIPVVIYQLSYFMIAPFLDPLAPYMRLIIVFQMVFLSLYIYFLERTIATTRKLKYCARVFLILNLITMIFTLSKIVLWQDRLTMILHIPVVLTFLIMGIYGGIVALNVSRETSKGQHVLSLTEGVLLFVAINCFSSSAALIFLVPAIFADQWMLVTTILSLLGTLCLTLTAIMHLNTMYKISSAAELRDYAYHDALTGLLNRRSFDEMIDALLGSQRSLFALLFIDFDGFKQINRNYGYLFGDEVLRLMSAVLNKNTRSADRVYRIGGDEFLIITFLESGNLKTVKQISSRLIKAFSRKMLIDGVLLKVAASIGIALYPKDGRNIKELLAKSDHAMTVAKKSTNKVWFFHEVPPKTGWESHRIT